MIIFLRIVAVIAVLMALVWIFFCEDLLRKSRISGFALIAALARREMPDRGLAEDALAGAWIGLTVFVLAALGFVTWLRA